MNGAQDYQPLLGSVNSADTSSFVFLEAADEGMLEKHLPQDPIYISHSALKPKEFDFHCTIPHDRAAPLPNGGQRFVADEDASPEGSKGRFEVAILEKETNHVHQIRAKMVPIEQVQARLKSSFKGKGKEEDHHKDCEAEAEKHDVEPNDCIILSACAYVDNGIDHILDGYSYALITRVSGDQSTTHVNVLLRAVSDDQKDLADEKNGLKKFGLFTGRLSWWRKLFCGGRAFQLITTGRAVDRRTAHQPIFFPAQNHAYFASAFTYPAFSVNWQPDKIGSLVAEEIPGKATIWSAFPKNDYVCMHPLFEASSGRVLTYTFLHSKIGRKTAVRFYEFGPEGQSPVQEYEVRDRAALHMFGFTENYFVIFANSLQVKPRGTCLLCCGTPILRTLNDDFCGDLKIHFIPRFHAKDRLKRFAVNTKQQGFVYHTINCFEDIDGCIIVDAFVSKLNAARESSQFELGDDPVHDNEGDPWRFHIVAPRNSAAVVESKILSTAIDSSIDFSTVNPKNIGKEYCHWWMVSHERIRDSKTAQIQKVVSHLYHVYVPYEKKNRVDHVRKIDAAMNYNPNKTLREERSSADWCTSKVSYLRTPLFVPDKDAKDESQGRLFAWSYDSENEHLLGACLLVFDGNLDSLVRIALPGNVVPYSVHSSVYARSEVSAVATAAYQDDKSSKKKSNKTVTKRK